MIIPTINLNGTHGPDLLDQHYEVLKALVLARTAMGNAYPNGRDFQTMPPGTLKQALTEANERAFNIVWLIEYYEAACIELSDQIENRKAPRKGLGS